LHVIVFIFSSSLACGVHRRHEQLALGALVEGCLGAMIISVDLLDCRLLVELDHGLRPTRRCGTNDGYRLHARIRNH
jgi:hypothetical protein